MKSCISVISVASVVMCLAPETMFGQTSRAVELARDPRMVMWRQTFFWAVVLFIVFLVAALAILRFSLRYRSYVLRDEPPPTASEDVWAMHRVADDGEQGED